MLGEDDKVVLTDFDVDSKRSIRPGWLDNWGEARRLKALRLSDAGSSLAGDCCPPGCQLWRRQPMAEESRARRARQPASQEGSWTSQRLSPDQTTRLVTLLAGSPRIAGVEADQWTRVLIRDLILREFGVSYHLAHVSRLL
jgi:hypothetical protein